MSGLPVAGRRVRQMDVHTMIETSRRDEGVVFLALFALTIPAANWLIGHAGTVCQPQGPCLVPVAPGLMAPSGVTMAGVALVLRDLVQRRLGVAAASLAILAGAVLSALLAPPALVIASAVAFLLSEFADLAVYTPLARRGLVIAVVASGVVGLVVDSVVRSEEHTSELQSPCNLVCRLLLEKKKQRHQEAIVGEKIEIRHKK